MNALRIAATGMAAQQTRVDVISNNLANMNTTGYRARNAEFADLVYIQQLQPGAISSSTGDIVPAGIQLGMGVRTASVSIEIQQGGLSATGGDLDLAIEGRGYFQITLPSGDSGYTRDGAFFRNGEGLVVNTDGFPLSDNITIPDDTRRITISADGEVTAFFEDQANGQQLGTITLTTFVNPKGLEAIGSNLFRETAASGAPFQGAAGEGGVGTMRQGFLEDSTVDVVEEIADLIEAQRGYELNSQVITASDEMLAAVGRIR